MSNETILRDALHEAFTRVTLDKCSHCGGDIDEYGLCFDCVGLDIAIPPPERIMVRI